mmetsp:Transcript_5822/g.11554  ORF Transcript_5822/g.11554 Transcript_5822/m.11554 type:complete len:143 (+) Transcript_5822:181-609(+)
MMTNRDGGYIDMHVLRNKRDHAKHAPRHRSLPACHQFFLSCTNTSLVSHSLGQHRIFITSNKCRMTVHFYFFLSFQKKNHTSSSGEGRHDNSNSGWLEGKGRARSLAHIIADDTRKIAHSWVAISSDLADMQQVSSLRSYRA